MIVIVPSRARPTRAMDMATSARSKAQDPDSLDVVIVIDDTDPMLAEYTSMFRREGPTRLVVLEGRHRYTECLNLIAFSPEADGHDILGAFGDDVIFRTQGWDTATRKALSRRGIAYGDDLIHGKNHPTAVFMSRVVMEAIGWLALPHTKHQWADDAWKQLGQRSRCLRYMPDVVFEHMHPAVDKAEWDDTYRDVIGGRVPGAAKADYEGFIAWVENGGLITDSGKVRALPR